MNTSHQPTFDEEQRLWRQGFCAVAGLDEAGRGALAGPVVAAAVIPPPLTPREGVWALVRDSKLLAPDERATLAVQIRAAALAWAVGSASAEEIDEIGIAPATRLAMRRAVESLTPQPDYLLLDWVRLTTLNIAQESFVKGDRRVVSIAAASILAKTHRDQILVELDRLHPVYGFAQHKGYGTAAHLAALARHGPCPAHRHSFAPLRSERTLWD